LAVGHFPVGRLLRGTMGMELEPTVDHSAGDATPSGVMLPLATRRATKVVALPVALGSAVQRTLVEPECESPSLATAMLKGTSLGTDRRARERMMVQRPFSWIAEDATSARPPDGGDSTHPGMVEPGAKSEDSVGTGFPPPPSPQVTKTRAAASMLSQVMMRIRMR
jgi:hypothetical protein